MKIELDLELPGEVLDALKDQDLAARVKEALVMELLREHRISQGKAAELLGISRSDLFPLMARYQVSAIDLSPEELARELEEQFPPQ